MPKAPRTVDDIANDRDAVRMSGRHLAFPFRIGADGRTATPATVRRPRQGRGHPAAADQPGRAAVPAGLRRRAAPAGLRGEQRRHRGAGQGDHHPGDQPAGSNTRVELTALEVEERGRDARCRPAIQVIATGESRPCASSTGPVGDAADRSEELLGRPRPRPAAQRAQRAEARIRRARAGGVADRMPN